MIDYLCYYHTISKWCCKWEKLTRICDFMTVFRKETLLRHHAYSTLRLIHAAFVDSYEYHCRGSMPVNRLLFVCGESSSGESSICDTANGTFFPMKEGNLYFIPYKHLVVLDIAPGLPFVSLQFNFELFYGFDVFENHPHCEMIKDPFLVKELRFLMDHDAELRTLYRINEIVFHLCGLWSTTEMPDIRERLTRSRKYDKILEFVKISGDATTTVEMLADMKAMRKDVFSRNFTRDMGITPKDFISDVIVRKASKILLTPGTPVNKVAKKLNFSSEYYFSHFFKRRTGLSPKEFSRQNGGK